MKNLVILNMARTGSSMVMGIFAAHGYNAPEGLTQDTIDGARYFSYELFEVKGWLRKNRIPKAGTDQMGEFWNFRNMHEFRKIVLGFPEPWALKVGINSYRLVEDLPAVFVKVRRDLDAHARSMATKKRQDFHQTREDIKLKGSLYDFVPGHDVFSDGLIAGDYSALVPVFADLGLPMIPSLVEKMIDQDSWHYHER